MQSDFGTQKIIPRSCRECQTTPVQAGLIRSTTSVVSIYVPRGVQSGRDSMAGECQNLACGGICRRHTSRVIHMSFCTGLVPWSKNARFRLMCSFFWLIDRAFMTFSCPKNSCGGEFAVSGTRIIAVDNASNLSPTRTPTSCGPRGALSKI